MELHESGENYLEAILVLKEKRGTVRAIDIAHHMDFSKPSVSRAMGVLRESGYITTSQEGLIELTQSGHDVAEQIYERHRLMKRWLIALGVSPETAAEDACRIEHDISPESFQKLREHIVEFLEARGENG